MPESKVLDVSGLLSSLISVFKAVPNDQLEDLKTVTDMFNEPNGEHKLPSRGEVLVGPAESMRGGNVGPMIGRHSSPAEQEGMTRMYESFEGLLRDFQKSYDKKLAALAGVLSDMAKAQQGVQATLKSALEASTAAAPVVDGDTYFGKANLKLANARKAFRKAELDEDDDEREERKSRLTEISAALKSVLKLINKSEDEEKNDEEEVEKAVAAAKALQGKVSVALAAIQKAEDEEKEEEAEKARQAAAATAKAEEDEKEAEKARQATAAAAKAEDTEEEKEDDTAKSVASLAQKVADVQKAVAEGNAVQTITLQEMMQTIAGISKGQVNPPSFMPTVVKSAPDAAERIRTAIDGGELNSAEDLTAATTLLQRSSAVEAGRYPRENFQRDIAQAPSNIRSLFAA